MHTQDELLTEAAVIRDETVLLANTADRVGTMHQHTVEALYENVTYTDPTPTGVGIGAISTGTSLVGRSVLSILIDLFKAPYKPASVGLNGGGLYEKGLVGGVSVNLSGSISPNDDTIAARRLKRTLAGVTTILYVPPANGVAYVDAGLTANASYVLEADTVASGTKSSGAVSATLVAPSYSGIVTSLTPSEANVKALAKQVWAAGQRAITFTNNNQRIGFFEPKANGRRAVIKNQNGYDVTAAFTYSEAAFTLPDGTSELYAGYVLTDPAGDGTAFTYTFY
jgi:hypothetical protein